MFGFGGGVSFDPAKDIPDLAGKVILVTGGNSGLGAESIKQLAAHHPAEIWLAARTKTTAEAVADEVKAAVPTANIIQLELDLTSLDSVKAAAATFRGRAQRLDILMLNAGIAFNAPGLTKDGYELQFGTNHVGHALLTKLLLPVLLETAAAPGSDVRVVVIASEAYKLARSGIDFDVLATENRAASGAGRYGVSKLANIYFARELAARYPAVRTIALHPGTVSTPIVRGVAQASPWLSWPLKLVPLLFTTVQNGAKNQLWASTADAPQSGKYYNPVGKLLPLGPIPSDDKQAAKLWEWTEAELAKHGAAGWP